MKRYDTERIKNTEPEETPLHSLSVQSLLQNNQLWVTQEFWGIQHIVNSGNIHIVDTVYSRAWEKKIIKRVP